jgi:hypothetical protein
MRENAHSNCYPPKEIAKKQDSFIGIELAQAQKWDQS